MEIDDRRRWTTRCNRRVGAQRNSACRAGSFEVLRLADGDNFSIDDLAERLGGFACFLGRLLPDRIARQFRHPIEESLIEGSSCIATPAFSRDCGRLNEKRKRRNPTTLLVDGDGRVRIDALGAISPSMHASARHNAARSTSPSASKLQCAFGDARNHPHRLLMSSAASRQASSAFSKTCYLANQAGIKSDFIVTEPLKAGRIGFEELGLSVWRPGPALGCAPANGETLDHRFMREDIGIGIMPLAEAVAGQANAGFLIGQIF